MGVFLFRIGFRHSTVMPIRPERASDLERRKDLRSIFPPAIRTGPRLLRSLFKDLVEAAPDAMVIADRSGQVVLLNAQAERLFGYSREELIGKSIDLLLPDQLRAKHATHREAYNREPHTRPMGAGVNLNGRRKDGSEFPAEISLSPIVSKEGLLITAAIRDVTERRRHAEELVEMRRQAEEANRLKSEFLANMSHELRTPLNSVIGFTELIHDGKAGPVTAEQTEYLEDVLSSAQHLLQLINDILDLAKIEAGKLQLRPEPIRLSFLAEEVCGSLRTVTRSKAITLDIDIPDDTEPLFSDPARVKQILYNYLSNALKFTPEGGRVSLSASPNGADAIRLAVRDTGAGISNDDLKRLFIPFHQLDASASKKYQGTGLGLALTKRIVEALGGQVGAESVLGSGSTFYALLPKVLASPASSPEKKH